MCGSLHDKCSEALHLYEEARKRWMVMPTHGPSLVTYTPDLSERMGASKTEETVCQEWLARDKVETFINLHAMSQMLFALEIDSDD